MSETDNPGDNSSADANAVDSIDEFVDAFVEAAESTDTEIDQEIIDDLEQYGRQLSDDCEAMLKQRQKEIDDLRNELVEDSEPSEE
jgi:exonuclease VII small subunit